MDFENVLFMLLLVLISINAMVAFANNFIVIGTDEFSGLPLYFTLNSGDDTYSFSRLQGTVVQLKVSVNNVISDVSISSIFSLISAFLTTLGSLGEFLLNLGTGYMRLIQAIFSPLNSITGADSSVGMGDFVAGLVNVIIIVIVIIGAFNWLKGIAASISGAI